MTAVDDGKSGRWLSSTAQLLAIGAVFVSAGGVSLHLAGYIAQKSYLRAFNVDPDSFVREVDWLLVNGYYSTVPMGSALAKSFFNWGALIWFAWLFAAIVLIRFGSLREPPRFVLKLKEKIAKRTWGRSRLLWFGVESFLYSGLAWSVTYLLALLTFMVLLVPGAVGETSGNKAAKEDASRFVKGCLASNPCSEFWKGDKQIASGFVVATSSDQIAFFDAQLKLVRQLERSGLEVRSPINPKFVPATKVVQPVPIPSTP